MSDIKYRELEARHVLTTHTDVVVVDLEDGSSSRVSEVYTRPGALALVAKLAAQVLNRAGCSSLSLMGCPRTLPRSRRRGRRWRDFPLTVQAPVQIVERDWGDAEVVVLADPDGPIKEHLSHRASAIETLRHAEVVILGLIGHEFATVDPSVEAKALAKAYEAISAVRGQADCHVVLLRIGRASVLTDMEGLRAMTARSRSQAAFEALYTLNAKVILGRLLTDVYGQARAAAAAAVGGGGVDDGSFDRFAWLANAASQGLIGYVSDPLALQVLYRLCEAGDDGLPLLIAAEPKLEGLRHGVDPLDANGGAWMLRMARTPHDADGLVWCGSGRWDGVPCQPDHVQSVVASLVDMRLVEVVDGAVRLAPVGRSLLDAVHPDLEDADLPLRWTGAGEDCWPSMESWLSRNFRKVKARMATEADDVVT